MPLLHVQWGTLGEGLPQRHPLSMLNPFAKADRAVRGAVYQVHSLLQLLW